MIGLAVILIGVVVLMACNQTQTIGAVIHNDPEIPVPPPNDEFSGNGSPQVLGLGSGGQVYVGPGSEYWATHDADGNIIGPAFSDPQRPIEPSSGEGFLEDPGSPPNPGWDDAPPQFVEDPWSMDPVYVPPNPQLPVKFDPVAQQPIVYNDPQYPVPTDSERMAASPPPVIAPVVQPPQPLDAPGWYAVDSPPQYLDPELPLPTHASDPAQFWSPPPIEIAPPENPMENWTAENSEETECPPSVEIEYSGGAM